MNERLTVIEGDGPLVVSLPHTGTDLVGLEPRLASAWLARKDADWHVERLHDFAADLGATVVHTAVSRTVIDVNRDPSGASLYPGMATTELCPTTTFDGEPLYRHGRGPDAGEIAERRRSFFDPYHATLRRQIDRLRSRNARVVVYDCHSIRSVVPRLFDGVLPQFNVGTNDGKSCDPALTARIEAAIDVGEDPRRSRWALDGGRSISDGSPAAPPRESPPIRVTNGRFKGGYITRHHGDPASGVHAIQMELAIRGYLREPIGPVDENNWPPPYDAGYAEPMRDILRRVLQACLDFAKEGR